MIDREKLQQWIVKLEKTCDHDDISHLRKEEIFDVLADMDKEIERNIGRDNHHVRQPAGSPEQAQVERGRKSLGILNLLHKSRMS